jgi:hypothetical protein
MEIAMEPNGGPWCATANQVTNTLTASPTQGPATLTGCAYRHDSFVQPVGLRNSDFFDEAENQKDQQGRSLVAPRQPRTLWLPKTRHECERECRGYQYANVIKNSTSAKTQESIIKTRHLGGDRTAKDQPHCFTERSTLGNKLAQNVRSSARRLAFASVVS